MPFVNEPLTREAPQSPPPQAIYWILRSCLNEMTRAGLVQPIVSRDCDLSCRSKCPEITQSVPQALQDWVEVKERRQAGAVLTSSAEDRCSDALHDLAVLCHVSQSVYSIKRGEGARNTVLVLLAEHVHVGTVAPKAASARSCASYWHGRI